MSTHVLHSVPSGLLGGRDDAARTDPALWVAAALFLAVVIADAVFIALAAPSLADIGSLYITTT